MNPLITSKPSIKSHFRLLNDNTRKWQQNETKNCYFTQGGRWVRDICNTEKGDEDKCGQKIEHWRVKDVCNPETHNEDKCGQKIDDVRVLDACTFTDPDKCGESIEHIRIPDFCDPWPEGNADKYGQKIGEEKIEDQCYTGKGKDICIPEKENPDYCGKKIEGSQKRVTDYCIQRAGDRDNCGLTIEGKRVPDRCDQ